MRSFAAGKTVKARAVTNYYDKESANNSEFFATVMDIGVKKRQKHRDQRLRL